MSSEKEKIAEHKEQSVERKSFSLCAMRTFTPTLLLTLEGEEYICFAELNN